MRLSPPASKRSFKLSALYSAVCKAVGLWWPGGERVSHSARRAVRAHRRDFMLEAMEPRLLLSADPLVSSAAGAYTATFGNSDDVVGIELVSSAVSGVIVDLTYIDNASVLTKVTLGDATNGVTNLTIFGGDGNDRFTADALGAGVSLTIHGGAGNDTFVGPDNAPGNNVDGGTTWSIASAQAGSAAGIAAFDGIENLTAGNRSDTLDYSGYASGVTVDLAADPDFGTATGFTQIKGFENVVGSAHNDTITGDAGANILSGGAGANILTGGAGTDTVVESGSGNFTLTAASLAFGLASDTLAGIEQATLSGDGGASTFDVKASALTGPVILIGGAGDDTYVFDASQTGNFFLDETEGGIDTLDLSASTVRCRDRPLADRRADDQRHPDPHALGGQRLRERQTGSGKDKITGNELDNILTGGAGDDELSGDIGDDTYVLANGWGVGHDHRGAGGNDGEGIDTIDFTAVTTNVTVTQLADGTFTMVSGANSLAFDDDRDPVGRHGGQHARLRARLRRRWS